MKAELSKLISNLSADERQSLVDELHHAAIYPSRLKGMGTPAHVEAINANLNDLRQIMAMQSANISRFYEIVAPRVAAQRKPPADQDRTTPSDE